MTRSRSSTDGDATSLVPPKKRTRSPDHPRACGELPTKGLPRRSSSGSSTRMRGTQPAPRAADRRHRIIPAHAGNSHVRWIVMLSLTDHPRACGELVLGPDLWGVDAGSSPRMRGTRQGSGGGRRPVRIIPAHAGNSHLTWVASGTEPDHPRACGELVDAGCPWLTESGSSPRMRGTQMRGSRYEMSCRIIPAHAGNSTSTTWIWKCSTDHPRACGELHSGIIFAFLACGSSPRMRGTRCHTGSRSRFGRIIPAHAGNSRPAPRPGPVDTDHPRACGELQVQRHLDLPRAGSSPRMRGTLGHDGVHHLGLRIIPAHAGNSLSAWKYRRRRSDHPRACGELMPVASCMAL